MKSVPITYFSDVLCVWAYVAQLRVDALKAAYGDKVRFEQRFCSVFGDTARKIADSWKTGDSYKAFNAHLRHVAEGFPEIPLHNDLWLTTRPPSSAGPHLFLKAVHLAETAGDCSEGSAETTTRAFRRAFFEQARDIARWSVQHEVAKEAGIRLGGVEARILDGRAFAALSSDYRDAEQMGIHGSPSFVLNEGRQKLYGNVGYRIIDANIQELLREPHANQASWC
ncbi:MAG: DsbA family protein [Alphaproteobacteria bacterium]